MHDIDRALFESEAEDEAYGEDEGFFETDHEDELEDEEEYGDEREWEGVPSMGDSSGRDAGMAAELLSVTSEEELDQFLGKLLRSAATAVRGFAGSDLGKAVGGVLKSAAVESLPHLAPVVGAGSPTPARAPGRPRPTSGRTGAAARPRARTTAARELGLQTEGLSPEDREFEAARAFVRFGKETAQRAARNAGTRPPVQVAQQAAAAAARRTLPGLVRPTGPLDGSSGPARGAGGPRSSGRWIRRGRGIVLLGT